MSTFKPTDHFGFLTNRVARLINKYTEPYIHSAGHSFACSCIGVMADLWANDGVSQKDLGVSLIKNKSSINKMLSDLEKDNLITKKKDPDDARSKKIYLTEKGRKMQGIIQSKSRIIEEELLQDFTKAEIQIAKNVLGALYTQLYSKEETKANISA